MKRFSIALNVVLAGVLLMLVGGQTSASTSTQYLTIPAAGMTDRLESEHNDNNNTVADACAATQTKTTIVGGENKSDLDNAKGSYLFPVNIPDGMTVTAFTIFANDADNDNNVHAYLVRNDIGNDIAGPQGGYEVMADAASSGAVTDTLRKFSDTTITSPLIKNKKSLYFAELVVCPVTEPYAIQIAYQDL